jgi:capsular exopolysaccharide synthesis family protein
MVSLQEPVYEAEAHMLVRRGGGDTIFESGSTGSANEVRAIATEIEVLKSQVVSDRVTRNLALSRRPTGVDGATVGATDVVSVTVRSGDRRTATALADAYVQAYIEVRREQAVNSLIAAGSELQRKITELRSGTERIDAELSGLSEAEGALADALTAQRRALVDQEALFKQRVDQLQVDAALTTGGADLVRSADIPSKPLEPTPLRAALFALALGLMIGIGAAFAIDYLDDSIRTADDLERSAGLPVLAVVPLDVPPDHRPIAMSRPGDFAVETYRGLRTSLQFLSVENEARVLQVTSPLAGEGKTTTAANLAVVFSQAGFRVVLIDADLRKPRLHQVFGLDGDHGLTDVLLGEPLDLALRGVALNLDVLPSGRIPPNPSELLGGRQLRALIELLADQYDMVVLDSAPVLPVTDSVALAASVQGVLLVTQATRTVRKQVTQALAHLRRVHAPMLGAVLNKAPAKRSAREYGYGAYGYGRYGAPVTGRPIEASTTPSLGAEEPDRINFP